MTATQSFVAEHGIVDGVLVERPRYDVDANGTLVRLGTQDELAAFPLAPRVRDWGHAMVLPGFVDAHSHAFQRAIRGATHRREADESTFWSWRTAMYRVASALEPEGVFEITRLAFAEMLRAGITCVGEFHYLHHAQGGQPYDDPNELSWQIVRAAEHTGIRLVLLEVFYERAGAGAPPLPEQRRFCDRDVDAYLVRVDALRARGVDIGIAPHSVRAVGRTALARLAEYAGDHGLPLHVHVSEQPRENAECVAEHGCSPTQLLAEIGFCARPNGFTAVHAIHLDDADRHALAGQQVCVCPTTEADLGDGLVGATELQSAGVELALGSDSNAVIDLIQEARLLEMGERLRTGRRICMGDPLELALLRIGSLGGARALGCAARRGELRSGADFDAAV
ncbi:MAG: formimidoylglutamate deiminase, partial [Deltaproteobacteria bacterium]|nr:formimidoylglutamate deiminase [Nannocystaceae bacterium]